MDKLTDRQQEILELIRTHIEIEGAPPTRAEIARHLGFRSANAAEGHLKALARKGAIELVSGASRGIRLCGPRGLPVVGRVSAGTTLLTEENIEQYFQLDHRLFTPHADYLLRVSGMSMHEAGITDGDLLAVHRTHEALDNQIVVARVGNMLTVKRFRQQGGQVQLLSANPEYPPMELGGRHPPLQIEGIGVGVVRSGLL